MSTTGTPIVAPMNSRKFNNLGIAPAYSARATYSVGDTVTYKSTIYICKTAITTREEWTPAHWISISVAEQLMNQQDNLDELNAEKLDKAVLEFIYRKAKALYDRSEGQEFDILVNTDAGYSKLVPAGVVGALVDMIGGKSVVDDGEIISANVTGFESTNGGLLIEQLYLPTALLTYLADKGYGLSVGTVYNELNLETKKYIQRVASRAYESGDEDDTSVLTDGTTTLYSLTTPIEYPLDDYLPDDFVLETAPGGQFIFSQSNELKLDIPNKLEYLVNESRVLP